MKWNILLGSLVLGLGLCTQSFGFELLDRMLGINNGCGCETSCEAKCGAAPQCCDTAPKCCAQPAPSCCEQPSCQPKCRKPLLDSLLSHVRCCNTGCADQCGGASCCEAAVAPKCGCEVAAPACGESCCRGSLLDRIFSCHRNCCKSRCQTGCAQSACGCSGGVAAPAEVRGGEGDMAPMPPAPVVDPSAFVPSKRRVVRASTTMVR